MTRETQDIGHCKRCSFQWVIREASVYTNKRGTRSKPPSLQCPFCGSGNIRIEKELAG